MDEQLEHAINLLQKIQSNLRPNTGLSDIQYIKHDCHDAFMVDYPDSDWAVMDKPLSYNCDDKIIWIRFRILVPDNIFGLSITNGQIRLRSMYQAPVELYINGSLQMKENNWIDLQTPELVLADKAVPGTLYVCAMRIDAAHANWGGCFNCFVEYDNVDSLYWDIGCLQEELRYVSKISGDKNIINKVLTYLAPALKKIIETNSGDRLLQVINEARIIAEPLRILTKSTCIHLIAHAHIDMNWLWDMQETRDLIKRDFSTLCTLMDEYPSLCFSQSQCATYQIAQRYYPKLFNNICNQIQTGKWDVTASAWVENDTNMPSGESLARQILYSQKYLQSLEVKPKIMWAPDTFGHSGNLPQLLHKSGITRYFHSRCFPEVSGDYRIQTEEHLSDHPLYLWEGIDGSRILSATMGYGGNVDIKSLLRHATIASKAGLKDALYVFGVGDHGGGPTRRDIKHILHSDSSPMLPELILDTTDRYFSSVEQHPLALEKLLVHKGELNFIFEGCYTSHAGIKKSNREIETLLYETELLCVMSSAKGMPYPVQLLEECWKILLFHQFHDIFDGCAIAETYLEAAEQMNYIHEKLDNLRKQALMVLTKPLENHITYFNMLPHTRSELVSMNIPKNMSPYNEKGLLLRNQYNTNGNRLVYLEKIPPMGSKTIVLKPQSAERSKGNVEETIDFYIINGLDYCVWLKKSSGEIVTFFDKHSDRFLVRAGVRCSRMDRGSLNTFSITKEITESGMSSWVYDRVKTIHYLKQGAVCNLIEDGDLRKIISVEHLFGASSIKQDVIFDLTSPIIRFETKVDWHEVGSIKTETPTLRVGFSPQIACDGIINEIPFGTQKRPNIGAEYPQWRWSAVEDKIGGLVLFNDCKYGIYSTGSTMELSLVRSSWEPDLHADIGQHNFTYAIAAYTSSISETPVLAQAASLHSRLIKVDGCINRSEACILPVELPCNLVMSGFKICETSNSWIVRFYEAFGQPVILSLPIPRGVRTVVETETAEQEVMNTYSTDNSTCQISFHPYEIKTLRLNF